MILAIVGPEAKKFTPENAQKARKTIRELLIQMAPDSVISGACPFGGVDTWAREEATSLGLRFYEYPPKVNEWIKGYRPRNIQIATLADHVICITVRQAPGDKHYPTCRHCGTSHLSSGGCWTVSFARNLNKKTTVIVV